MFVKITFFGMLGVVTLLLLEGALWLLFPIGRETQVRVEANQEIEGLRSSIVFEKNHLGLRTRSVNSIEKTDNAIRVICIGASTTEQGSQSIEDTWHAHLENLLNESGAFPGARIEVAAYAKGGAKMHELMRWARWNLEQIQPDVVVTLFGINSLATDEAISQTVNFSDIQRWIERPDPAFHSILTGCSQTYRYIRNMRENGERRRYLEEHEGLNFDLRGLTHLRDAYWQTPIDHELTRREKRTELFAAKCDYFFEWLREKNLPAVVLGQPLLLHDHMDYTGSPGGNLRLSNRQVAPSPAEIRAAKEELECVWFTINTGKSMVRCLPGDFRTEMARFNAVQESAARTHQAAYVPLDLLIAPDRSNFFDDCHFTDLGSERVAKAILPAVHQATIAAARRRGLSPLPDANFTHVPERKGE